jgi:hypothetical protein
MAKLPDPASVAVACHLGLCQGSSPAYGLTECDYDEDCACICHTGHACCAHCDHDRQPRPHLSPCAEGCSDEDAPAAP